jgi:hypothetical protein
MKISLGAIGVAIAVMVAGLVWMGKTIIKLTELLRTFGEVQVEHKAVIEKLIEKSDMSEARHTVMEDSHGMVFMGNDIHKIGQPRINFSHDEEPPL